MTGMIDGLQLAARYSYPPNSLSLCGPNKQNDLSWYSTSQQTDKGTQEIIEQFATLYPYLCFIAGENHLTNPFDYRVIQAYWLGNSLLQQTQRSDFIHFLDDTLSLSKKLHKKDHILLKQKIVSGAFPHHAFHVLNVYRRTGHNDIPQTIETMDACIINWGKITNIIGSSIIVETRPLVRLTNTLQFGTPMKRKLRMQGEKDTLLQTLSVGDCVSYHWGYVCEKITKNQLMYLKLFTQSAIHFANAT